MATVSARQKKHMPSRFDPPTGPQPDPEFVPSHKPIDGSKRYDVYCAHQGSAFIVYRNMKIKGATPLLEKDEGFSRIGDFVELESATGKHVYVTRFSILALCEHGTPFPGEFVSPK
jgi:hypothetical protein